jgi:hypothetical protein
LLEKTKYALTEHDLEKREQVLIKQKEYRALVRKHDEDKKIFSLKKRLERQKKLVFGNIKGFLKLNFFLFLFRIDNEKIKEQEVKDRNAIEQAKKARHVATKFLQTTLRE